MPKRKTKGSYLPAYFASSRKGYTKVRTTSRREGPGDENGGGSSIQRIITFLLLVGLLILYYLPQHDEPVGTKTRIQKVVAIDERGRIRSKKKPSYDEHKHEAMAPELHVKRGIQLINPYSDDKVEGLDILDDEAMEDADEKLAEHDEDNREPSQQDIQHSQVWKSTDGRKAKPPRHKKKRKGHGRRPVRKPVPLPSTAQQVPALPAPAYASKPVALRVIVLTMNRASALSRLLRSLRDAEYGTDRIELDIWIDRPEKKGIDDNVRSVADAMKWDHGKKTIHEQPENVGLAHQWIHSWDASVSAGLQMDMEEEAVILEDDLQVSKYFWKWLKACHMAYANRPDFNGCTLQRASLCAASNCKNNLKGGNVPDGTNFYYPLVGSWGFSPQKGHWIRFRNWYLDFVHAKKKPYVSGLTPTVWYKQFEKQGRCPGKKCMWTMYHIKYCSDHRNKYTVYLKAPKGQTLATNFQEPGLHYKGKPKMDAPTLTHWSAEMGKFSMSPIVTGYNGQEIPGYVHYKKIVELRGGKHFVAWQISAEEDTSLGHDWGLGID